MKKAYDEINPTNEAIEGLAEGKTHKPEDKHDLGRRTLWTSLGICIGGLSLGFWLHHEFSIRGWHVSEQIALHSAIAFLVAAILMVTLEFNAKRFTHREIRRFLDLVSRDVFEALLGRIVPSAIFDEINNILHSDVVRSNCEYFITFQPSDKLSSDYFLIRRDLMFTVTNLLNTRTTFWVRSSHSSEEDPNSEAWQSRRFHTKLSVDGKEIELSDEQKVKIKNGITVLEHPIRLEPQQSVRIFLRGEEPCRLDAGRNSYIQATPVIGIKVTITNEHPDVIGSWEIRVNHPGWWHRKDRRPDETGRYVLDQAFLPGQGFEVLWRSTEPAEDFTTQE